MSNTVVILDSNNTLYRMYHTQPPRSKGGQRVESASGTVNEAINFLAKKSVDKVISVFDANSKNFRHDIYPGYKGTRSGMPDDLKPQEVLAQQTLKAAGIPVIIKDGYEADDAIGMLAVKYADEGFNVIVVTTDKDMMQLVDDRTKLYNPITKKLIDVDAVKAKFNIEPANVAGLLAIKGDTQDNIIGIEKVGEKTAAKLLTQYGSLQGIIDHAQDIKGAVGKKIQEGAARLPLNLKLTTIASSPELLTEEELGVLRDSKPDLNRCKTLADTYGFRLESILAASAAPEAPVSKAQQEPAQGSLF